MSYLCWKDHIPITNAHQTNPTFSQNKRLLTNKMEIKIFNNIKIEGFHWKINRTVFNICMKHSYFCKYNFHTSCQIKCKNGIFDIHIKTSGLNKKTNIKNASHTVRLGKYFLFIHVHNYLAELKKNSLFVRVVKKSI